MRVPLSVKLVGTSIQDSSWGPLLWSDCLIKTRLIPIYKHCADAKRSRKFSGATSRLILEKEDVFMIKSICLTGKRLSVNSEISVSEALVDMGVDEEACKAENNVSAKTSEGSQS